jgi:hypothetical protein
LIAVLQFIHDQVVIGGQRKDELNAADGEGKV